MARKGGKDRGLVERVINGEKVWYVRMYHHGKGLTPFGPFHTKTEAKDWYRDRKSEQDRGQFFPETYRKKTRPTLITGELVEGVIKAHMQRPDMVKKKDRRMDWFYANYWTARCAGKGMGDLKKPFFQSIIMELEEAEYANQTIYNTLQFMRRLFNCYLEDHEAVNPFKGIMLPHADPLGRVTFLEDHDEPALLKGLGEHHLYATIFLKTGLRRSELIQRPWTDVDLLRGHIALPDPKAGRLQYQPLSKACIEVIAALPSRSRSPWLCPSFSDDSKPMAPDTFYHHVWEPAIIKAQLQKKGITVHTMRHTFASRLAMRGASDLTIATLLRHSNTALVRRYAHLRPSYLTGVLDGLDQGAMETPSVALERMEQAVYGQR